ncbi:RING finger and WD repeat domain-containing protein 3, partial [Coemansia brasiliensis]
MSGGTDAELSQSTSPPSLSQVFSGITNTAPRQHAATSCELSRNDSIASMQSVESSCAEQIPDTDQATETPNEEAVAGPGDGIRVPKRLRTETEHPSLRMAIAATSTANREAESSAQARSRRPGIAQERQSRFFASSESLQRTESEGASAATSDGQDDDSDDFAQPAAPLPPPLPQSRLRPQLPQASHQIVGQQQEADDVDDRNTCSVCLDPWSISGPHRVVSLKCGHLFGQSCAKKWLRRASQKRARQAGATSGSKIVGKCPECNQRAEWKDIRPIYARSIVAIDSTQMDELRSQLRELRDAKLKLEDEHRQFCTKYSEMRNEVARMRRELERSFEKCQWLQLQNANLLKQIGTPNRHASVATGDELSDDLLADSAADSAIDTEHLVEPAYLPCMRLRATIPMTSQKSESLRLLAVHPHEPLLFASYSKPSLRLHTLAQIDVHSASSRAFLLDLPHKQEIRGAKISPHAAGTRFLLTA